jgi:hypothetical protein
MNKFRIYILLLSAFSVLIVSACDKLFPSKPEDVLSEYLQADLVGDHKKAYSYISTTDKKSKSLEQYISGKSKYSHTELTKLFIENTTHKIENVEIDGDNAQIRVDTTTVDLEIITKEFANAGMRAVTTGKSFHDIQKDIAEKYKTQQLPLNNYKSNHQLIKEDNRWKVVLNL